MVPKIPALAAVFLVSDGVHPAPSTPLVGHGQGARSAAARACGLWDAAARLRAAPLAAETRSSRAVGSSPLHGSLGWAGRLKPRGPRKVRAAPAPRPTPRPHTPQRAHSARSARPHGSRAHPESRLQPSPARPPSPTGVRHQQRRGGRRRRGAAWRGRRRQAVERGAGRGPRAPGRLPVALESYSSRGRGRRVAGGGVRM